MLNCKSFTWHDFMFLLNPANQDRIFCDIRMRYGPVIYFPEHWFRSNRRNFNQSFPRMCFSIIPKVLSRKAESFDFFILKRMFSYFSPFLKPENKEQWHSAGSHCYQNIVFDQMLWAKVALITVYYSCLWPVFSLTVSCCVSGLLGNL